MIPDEVVRSVITFFLLYLVVSTVGGLLLALMGLDMVSAFGAAAACTGNVGPGFGVVGPEQGYALLPTPAKLLLVLMMFFGRLELYPLLILPFLRR